MILPPLVFHGYSFAVGLSLAEKNATDKHTSLFCPTVSEEDKRFYKIFTRKAIVLVNY